MLKARLFFWMSLGFISGVAVFSFFPLSFSRGLFYLTILPLVMATAVFYKEKKAVLTTLTILSFVIGGGLVNFRLQEIKSWPLAPKEFSGWGTIVTSPEEQDRKQSFVLKIEEINKIFYVMVSAYDSEKYSIGDRINLSCRLEIPKNVSDDFDYRMYLAKDRIFYTCYQPKILEKTPTKKSLFFLEKIIFSGRDILVEKSNFLFPAPESGLLVGILLGGNHELSKDIQESFSKTGVTHIVAVSGYNVTIVAEYLMILCLSLGLWRRQAFWVAVLGILIFVLMSGLPSSAVRAGAMSILLLWAMRHGRLANTGQAILFSATLMLLANPMLLKWDTGFQLSFLSTLGIVYVYPLWEKFFPGRFKNFLSEALGMTLAAQVMVLPILLNTFHQLSLVAPLTNILILPAVPIAMGLGFLAILFHLVVGNLSLWLTWLAFLPLKYIVWVVENLASWPYASLSLGVSWVWGGIWYIICLIGLIFFYQKND